MLPQTLETAKPKHQVEALAVILFSWAGASEVVSFAAACFDWSSYCLWFLRFFLCPLSCSLFGQEGGQVSAEELHKKGQVFDLLAKKATREHRRKTPTQRQIWVWVKIKPTGDRRFWSMLHTYQGNPFRACL